MYVCNNNSNTTALTLTSVHINNPFPGTDMVVSKPSIKPYITPQYAINFRGYFMLSSQLLTPHALSPSPLKKSVELSASFVGAPVESLHGAWHRCLTRVCTVDQMPDEQPN